MIYLLYGFYDGVIYEEDLLGVFSSEEKGLEASKIHKAERENIEFGSKYDGYKVKQAPLGELIGDK